MVMDTYSNTSNKEHPCFPHTCFFNDGTCIRLLPFMDPFTIESTLAKSLYL